MLSIDMLLVSVAAFAAGCIDAMVGGGGLIQTPTLFSVYPHASPSLLLGTNKFAGIFGTANAVLRFAKRVTIPWRALMPLAMLVLLTSMGGAYIATRVPPELFRPLVPVLLVLVLAYLLWKKYLGNEHQPRAFAGSHHLIAACLIGLIGFYDGFFGPGTGSFLMFVFVRFYGYDFLNSAACARVLNVATNAAALLYFGSQGDVMWRVGVLMAVCNIAGSMLGTRWAIGGGSQFVRKVFIVVVVALIVRNTWLAIR